MHAILSGGIERVKRMLVGDDTYGEHRRAKHGPSREAARED